ncbi:DNA mismatch repair protein MutS [Stemphylium lycopersici]|nr:DNA mismatch repair protein MutS [Stemphylium lycopersici]
MPGVKIQYTVDPNRPGEPRPAGLGWLPNRSRHLLVSFVGEFVGTFLFLFFAFAGTQVANNLRNLWGTRHMNIASLLYISLAFGFSLAVNVWVTIALALIGAVGWIKALLLIVAQLLGAIVAAAIVSGLLPGPLAVNTTLSQETSVTRGLFIEMFLTFMLLLTIFMLAAEKHRATFVAPIVIGLALFIAELGGVYFTGGSLNPARSFGPAVVTGVWPGHHWIYWVGPLLGALLAVAFYKLMKLLDYATANPGADSDGLELYHSHSADRSQTRYDTAQTNYHATDGTGEQDSAMPLQTSTRQPNMSQTQAMPSLVRPATPTPAYMQTLDGHRSEIVNHPDDRPRAHHKHISPQYEMASDSGYRNGPSAESGSSESCLSIMEPEVKKIYLARNGRGIMARGVEGNEMSTPRPSQKKQPASASQSAKNQKSILGFFQKKSTNSPSPAPSDATRVQKTPTSAIASKAFTKPSTAITPVPSSDAPDYSSPIKQERELTVGRNKENGPSSPLRPADAPADPVLPELAGVALSSPTRKGRKPVNYAESDEDEDDVLTPIANNARGRATKRQRVVVDDDSDDEFGLDAATQKAMLEDEDDDDDVDDFIVPDDSEEEVVSKKRKRPTSTKPRTKAAPASSPPVFEAKDDEDEGEVVTTSTSTAQQWIYDPENPMVFKPKSTPALKKEMSVRSKAKPSASEPEARYPWLANMQDADRHPIDHPDYDPRTLYIPPNAWNHFSPFEKQYWEIKSKWWDTVVFFKKGKFYELYEKDASIGHQLFDLKLTDRVNMRMVGVPEASLDMWATQFVAAGHKVARVDQMESALGKEMRERDDKGKTPKKPEKKGKEVIRRELATVLTSGTLVDTGMLQSEMSTYCMAIKEIDRDNLPAFGVAFVDTATAQFQLCEFTDDIDMTKFETLIAQMRPGELLLEKSCVSAKALRILKNNTGPTTIWNWLKLNKEFWPADITIREIEANNYFESPTEDNIEAWPAVLREAREQELVMSAFGALLQYLRTLMIERDLVTLGNFQWYDPIRKATSLVLDGQSLINLEIFANTFDGATEGTLFAMLNRCITPFGKRLLRQWVCHPLADAQKINARLDAVDALNKDSTIMENFSGSLSKLPDLERLISRVHAGRCKAQDFLKVLEGFEQIEYTISLLKQFSDGEGVIGHLISSMPDLAGALEKWKSAFDRNAARKDGILIPESGVEEDYDNSQAEIDNCEANLDTLLKKARKELGSNAIIYNHLGKEIYQLEVPKKVKVPNSWDQMSATAKVTRYYTPELRKLVRALQEAQETHGQITREVATRFCQRFDEDYQVWLAAVKIIAQLDCLISLAKASASMGEPSCRPVFEEGERTVVEFEELRHPCMLNTVDDFIPNDIRLGGDASNISLLTGANAAGKSTILRMTCIAVILAQVGCYLPCTSARLTPVDRIMSRLGANDNIFAAQSTFFVELSETQKILSEATPRSLVILDELGRGTSSYDGVAVAQAVLHDIASRVGCVGFFATHYRSLAKEFELHPEVENKRMRIHVDDESKSITFLYKLEEGVAEGSFGMHCAAMCGIPSKVIEDAEKAAKSWEHTSRLGERMEVKKEEGGVYLPLGIQSDVAWALREGLEGVGERTMDVLLEAIAAL